MKIITLHSNTHMCGVSKFNRILSSHLSVEMVALDTRSTIADDYLIVSISFAEFTEEFEALLAQFLKDKDYGLIVHGLSAKGFQEEILRRAKWVLALNDEIYSQLSSWNLAVLELGWCPPTIPAPEQLSKGRGLANPDSRQLFMFGMSKKFSEASLDQLEQSLGSDADKWTLVVSAGLHENSTFDDAFFAKIEHLRSRTKLKVFFAGFLSDEAVSVYLRSSRACVLIFQPSARANNSTLVSAIDHGCQVITNVDQFTPSWMLDLGLIFNIANLTEIPDPPEEFSRLPERFGWKGFVDSIHSIISLSEASNNKLKIGAE